jgi:hypothetical protein
MWRSVMAMLLIPTLTFGQSEHPASSQAHRSTGADSLDEQSAAVVSANTALGVPSLTSWVKPFPRYNELRRGTSEELLVDIRLAFEKQPNSGQVVIFPYGMVGMATIISLPQMPLVRESFPQEWNSKLRRVSRSK